MILSGSVDPEEKADSSAITAFGMTGGQPGAALAEDGEVNSPLQGVVFFGAKCKDPALHEVQRKDGSARWKRSQKADTQKRGIGAALPRHSSGSVPG